MFKKLSYQIFQANSIKEKAEVTMLMIKQNSRQEHFNKQEVGQIKLIKRKTYIEYLIVMNLLQPTKWNI